MSTADWYARKLGQPRPPAPPPPQHPAQPSVVQQPAQSPSLPPNPQPVEYAPKQAHLQKKAGRCPECDSGNYYSGKGNARPRCFDCGYPVDHSEGGPGGSGIGITSVGAVATTQVHGTHNYQPTNIIGRVE